MQPNSVIINKMRISKNRWYTVCAVLWSCAHCGWAYARADSTFTEIDDLSRDDGYERKLIPIMSPRVNPRRLPTRPLPLEPDAELLPAHYTGVKSPGVDHMELKYAESQILKASPKAKASSKSSEGRSVEEESRGQESEIESSKTGRQRVGSFEKGQKGDQLKTKQKTEYTEAGGKKRKHSDRDNNSRYEKEQATRERGASYRKKGSGNVDRKAAGFHNVYHKDEYNRDHDFYDNDDQGGHLKKHGRYKEKHVAIEGTFKKGNDRDSGFDEAELHKEGVARKSQVEGESKGHDARRGYDGFFENFQGFAKQGGRDEGKRFHFGKTNA
ncbi:uncharacterized protein LOC143177323 [Calliopsis andreniformis]|uniref:uncharacterized protein LOC143177323 n=1 Tax=Calliopsis andreniformis TaxID=337506 RepID=UPI003FCDB107